jgi:hypothetical protein
MSMGGFGFFRTIWLSIRATNYTTQAFQSANRNLTNLQKAELQFARSTMAVGTIYVAFGGIILQTISQIMATSALGEAVLTRFGDKIGVSIGKIGDALARILGPFLDFIASTLEIATAIPFFSEFAAIVMLVGTGIVVLIGVKKILIGVMKLLSVTQGHTTATMAAHQQMLTAYIPTTQAATGATLTFASALKMVGISAAVGFGVFIALKDVVGVLPAALFGLAAAFAALAVQMWLVAGATSVITAGAAAIAGAAALAGAIAVAQGAGHTTEFEMGTRFAPRTMLAMVHQGEAIFNTRTQKPVGMIEGLVGSRERSITRQNINFHIDTLNTKTDFDDTKEKMARETYFLFKKSR